MKILPIGHLVKTNPIQSQLNPKQTQYKPNQTQYNAKTNPILSAVLSGEALAKSEALAKADSKGAKYAQ